MKILNFLLRMVFGAIGIQIINAVLISQNISVFVGLNIFDPFDSRKPWNQRAGAALRDCGLRNFVRYLQ